MESGIHGIIFYRESWKRQPLQLSVTGLAMLRMGNMYWNYQIPWCCIACGKTNADSIGRFRASLTCVIGHRKLKEIHASRKNNANRSEVSVPSRQWRRNIEPGFVA